MNTIESRLREALDSSAQTVRQEDLRTLVAPTKPSPRRRFVVLAAAAAGVAALTLAAIQFWPPAVDDAVAWSATPKVDNGLAARVGAHCAKYLSSSREPEHGEPRWQPTVIDLRGHDALVVAVARRHFALCTFRGLGISYGEIDGLNATSKSMGWLEIPRGELPATGVSIEMVGREIGVYWGAAMPVGQVGRSVRRVVLVLDDGTQMQATTKNGWYVAWWPEKVRVPDDPTTVVEKKIELIRAYEASGKLLKELRPDGVPAR